MHHMTQLIALIASFRNENEGQGLAEYALILALIAIVAIVALIFLGGQISGILNTVGQSVEPTRRRRSRPTPRGSALVAVFEPFCRKRLAPLTGANPP